MDTACSLQKIVAALDPVDVTGPVTGDVCALIYDSRQVVPGCAFFALPGVQADGHAYIPQAVAAGARVIVHQVPVKLPEGVTGVRVAQSRRALAQASRVFYDDPAARLTVIGVTGTNGKTTICTLLEQVLRTAGRRPAVFGTLNYRFEGEVHPSRHTTPESVELLALARDFADRGADTLILEASSHALDQFRVDGLRFDCAIFTNLTPEHLDYHGEMERYYVSKVRLFTELLKPSGQSVIHTADSYGARLAQQAPRVLTVGAADADCRALHAEQTLDGIRATLALAGQQLPLVSPLVGAFNLSNLLCAAAAAHVVGLEMPAIVAALADAQPAPGRMERIANDRQALVLVDYAHTGDALEQVLSTVRALQPQRLITVFGCGGDRDRSKRAVMGDVAGRYSDVVLVTSDNPRTEDPQAILDAIRPGVAAHLLQDTPDAAGRYFRILPDRRQAIEAAVALLQPGDALVVAGKGHEDYQILGTERIHFDDREELRRALGSTTQA